MVNFMLTVILIVFSTVYKSPIGMQIVQVSVIEVRD